MGGGFFFNCKLCLEKTAQVAQLTRSARVLGCDLFSVLDWGHIRNSRIVGHLAFLSKTVKCEWSGACLPQHRLLKSLRKKSDVGPSNNTPPHSPCPYFAYGFQHWPVTLSYLSFLPSPACHGKAKPNNNKRRLCVGLERSVFKGLCFSPQ